MLLVSKESTRGKMKVDDIISYYELVHEEKSALQKGMNFNSGKGYSVFLMSIRKGAPYADELDKKTGNLIYEGHDVSKLYSRDPKSVDQPLTTPKGTWTENGKFYRTATDYKSGLTKEPHLIFVKLSFPLLQQNQGAFLL
jgi:hypothetical protein